MEESKTQQHQPLLNEQRKEQVQQQQTDFEMGTECMQPLRASTLKRVMDERDEEEEKITKKENVWPE